MRKLLFILILVLLGGNSLSQRIRFAHITIQDGLSQSTVNTILQDKNGFLWFGTQDGLDRYDGISMTVFKDDPSGLNGEALSDREILSLYEHDDGSLFIGTKNGLNIRNPYTGKITYVLFDSTKSNSISGSQVNDIARYSEKEVLICTNQGLDALNVKTGRVRSLISKLNAPSLELNFRHALLEENTIWIASYGDGLVEYSEVTGKAVSHIPIDEDGDMIWKSNMGRTLLIDSKGRFWIGYQGGYLAWYDKKSGSFEFLDVSELAFGPDKVTSVIEDSEGVIWLGTDEGVVRFNEEKQLFETFHHDGQDPFSLTDDYVLSLYEDEAGTLWAGTNAGGVNGYHRTLGKFNHVKKEAYTPLSLDYSQTVFGFEEDPEGHIWIATIGGGIARFSFQDEIAWHYTKETNNTHSSILCLEYADNKMWFGSYGGGINHFDFSTNEFSEPITVDEGLPSSTVLALQADNGGNLWIGTYKGLAFYDMHSDTILAYKAGDIIGSENGTPVRLTSGQITILLLNDRTLWIGTEGGGLFELDTRTRKVRHFNSEDGLSNNAIYGLCKSGDQMWVGTKSGLNVIDVTTGLITSYFTSDGLQSNFVYGILQDPEGNLWLSTNNGVTKFNPEKKTKGVYYFRHYSTEDGLQGNEFNQGAYFQSSKGEFFFGGVNGFNHFFPNQIKDNPHKPKVVMRSIKIMGSEIESDTLVNRLTFIERSYRDNFISFEFAALDFVLPEKNLYSFKLEGLDEKWSEPSPRNFATYTDLSPGEYVFKVRAANNDGVWSEEEYEIHIVIVPPFWQTTWFYILCVVVAMLSVFLFIRWRTEKIKREKKLLEEKVVQRTAELAAKTEELAEKNRDIMDSIHYAQKIQTAILPEDEVIASNLEDAFVLFLPKDIVSGDFYWFGMKDGLKIITAVDCTGHGVPGAFMSMIGSNLLNQIVLEKGVTKAGDILARLNVSVQQALKQGTDAQETNDGMDISLVVIDDKNKRIQWAGAYNPLYLIREGEMSKFRANKYPIGGAHMELEREYETHEVDYQKGDVIYMFSDGYVDQFGGDRGKKFMGKRFQKLLLEVWDKPMQEQRAILHKALDEWMEGYEQIDDICVIGVRL